MSLINEALKRAKQETIRREAAEKGVPLAGWPKPPARRSWMAMVILVLVAALASSLTALVLVSRNGSEQVVPAEIVQVAPPSRPAPVSEPIISTPPPAKTASPLPEPADTPAAVVAEAAATSSPVSPEPIAPVPSDDGSTIEIVAPIIPPPADAEETEPPVPEGPVYAHRVELPGGVTFELGGIAWSEYGPVALLNGRAVGRGERVEGYLIVEIEPEQIELRGDTGTIFLRLK